MTFMPEGASTTLSRNGLTFAYYPVSHGVVVYDRHRMPIDAGYLDDGLGDFHIDHLARWAVAWELDFEARLRRIKAIETRKATEANQPGRWA